MMVPVQGGRYLPFEIGYQGVVHECVPLQREPTRTTYCALERDGEPKTRRTPCWWCDDPVYYHTNGNGDSVLFDDLGPPWTVHYCWELHCESRKQHVHQFLTKLSESKWLSSQPETEWPEDVDNLTVTDDIESKIVMVSGYIFGWSTIQSSLQLVLRNPGNTEDWTRLRVVGSNQVGYPVWIPASRANHYRLGELVNFQCRLVPWGVKWYLVALNSEVIKYPKAGALPDRLATIGRSIRCRYCGDPLDQEGLEWGLDQTLRPECRSCHDLREGRTPELFLSLCRKVALHGRFHDG